MEKKQKRLNTGWETICSVKNMAFVSSGLRVERIDPSAEVFPIEQCL